MRSEPTWSSLNGLTLASGPDSPRCVRTGDWAPMDTAGTRVRPHSTTGSVVETFGILAGSLGLAAFLAIIIVNWVQSAEDTKSAIFGVGLVLFIFFAMAFFAASD